MNQPKGQMHFSGPVRSLLDIFLITEGHNCSSAVEFLSGVPLLLSLTCPVSSDVLRTYFTPCCNMPSFMAMSLWEAVLIQNHAVKQHFSLVQLSKNKLVYVLLAINCLQMQFKMSSLLSFLLCVETE